MEWKTLKFEIDRGVGRILLDRPQRGNALDDRMADELLQVVSGCENEPSVRALLLWGAGRTFSVGGDLGRFHARIDELPALLERMLGRLHEAILRLTRLELPVVAAVHGNVAGVGVSLMAAADLVLAAASSSFTVAYTAIGLSPDGGLSHFLPRIIGLRRALELTLTNRRLPAEEAASWGLVSRVVPDDELLDRASALARELARGPTRSFGAAKRLLWRGLEETLEAQLEHEARAIAAMAGSADCREGVQAFLQKRAPRFEGR